MNEIQSQEIPKNPHKFECIDCNYNTDNKKDYTKHELTAKHQKMQKDAKKCNAYNCILCKFITGNKNNFEKHNLTSKHLKKMQEKNEKEMSKKEKKEEEMKEFKENMMNALMQKDNIMKQLFLKMSETQEILIQTQENMFQQNKETQDKLLETQDKLLETQENMFQQNKETQDKLIDLVKESKTTIITQNTQNNTFNLNNFLNVECKNAKNILDFINDFSLEYEDLYIFKELGYHAGWVFILSRELKKESQFTRPIHCTDAKRGTLVIRHNDKWVDDHIEVDNLCYKAIQILDERGFLKCIEYLKTNRPQDCDDPRPLREYLKIYNEVSNAKHTFEELPPLRKRVAIVCGKLMLIDKKLKNPHS